MGVVLVFGHARASSIARRRQKAANVSAVKPASFAVRVRRMGSHHSGGIELRCGHLRTAESPAPISAAKASGPSQRATTSRKLEIMSSLLGQPVLKCKPIVSHDCAESEGHTVLMHKDAEKLADSQWREEFRQRLKTARRPRTQAVMAELLGITQTTYSKYEAERASQMPTRLLPLFCKICGVSLEWLIEGAEPVAEMPQAKRKKHAA